MEMLFIGQNIDGKDQAQKAIDNTAGQAGNNAQQPGGRLPHKVLNQLSGLIQPGFCLIPQVADNIIFHIQPAFQVVKEIAGIADIAGDVVGQAQQAFPNLRQDEETQTGDNGQYNEDGKHNADSPFPAGQLRAGLPQSGQPFGFHRPQQQVDNIGHHHTDDNRPQHRHNIAASSGQQSQMG